MKKIKQYIWQCVSEPDNKTICPVRVLAILGFLYFLGMNAYTTLGQGMPFNVQEFGTAFGVMMATVGVALGVKTDTPPEKE